MKAILSYAGLVVEGPVQPSDAEVPTSELTNADSSSCDLVCPFNNLRSRQDPISYHDKNLLRQPCHYTVRVVEVFKGNYSVRLTAWLGSKEECALMLL